jgi:hypothetical protein
MWKDTIETFLQQYKLYQEEQLDKEHRDRFESTVLEPKYSTKHPIEQHEGKLYTRSIYKKFLAQLHYADAFIVTEIERDKLYEVRKIIQYEEEEFYHQSFDIEIDLHMNKFDCICCKYERDGILCCHVLRLFNQLGIFNIPDTYINRRWTRMWKENVIKEMKQQIVEAQGDGKEDDNHASITYAMMMMKTSKVCASVSKDREKLRDLWKC